MIGRGVARAGFTIVNALASRPNPALGPTSESLRSFMFSNRAFITFAFVLLALPFELILVYLTPPFQVPDENQHYFYARSITEGTILPYEFEGGGMGGYITKADVDLVNLFMDIPFHPTVKATQAREQKAREVTGADVPVLQNYWQAALYPPVAYAAPAFGLKLGDVLGLGRLDAFYLGRAVNAVFFVLAVALSIWITPIGRPLIAFIFLLPMSLFEGASLSADAFTYALTALTCALVAYMAVRSAARRSLLWMAAALALAVAMVKLPLIALAVPVVVLAWRQSRRMAAIMAAAILVVWIGWVLHVTLTDSFGAWQKSLNGISSKDQLTFLLHHPLAVFKVAWMTLRYNGSFYVYSVIGLLGWVDTWLAGWVYALAIGVGVLVGAGTIASGQAAVPAEVRLSFAAAGLIAAALTFAALYLTWTPVGNPAVVGVQGRYFTPILAILAMSVAGLFANRRASAIETASAFLVILFAMASFASVVASLISRYYLS